MMTPSDVNPDIIVTEATLHRTRLLLGLTGGAPVIAWADAKLLELPSPPSALIDVSLTSSDDLSALRHALLPLAEDPESQSVVERVTAEVARDLISGRRGVGDTVAVLRQMRRMLPLPPIIDATFDRLVDSVMLADAGIDHSVHAAEEAVYAWARSVSDDTGPS